MSLFSELKISELSNFALENNSNTQMMKKNSWIVLLLMMGFLTYSCNSDDDNNTTVDNRTVKISENAAFGKVLTDKDGKTLYFFSRDYKGISACTSAGCVDTWPIFYNENLNIDNSLNAADFGTITRQDGKKQTTYKGWPLYYYKNDINTSDTAGDKVNNVWFVAKPDYTVMSVAAQLLGHNGKNYTASNNASTYTEGTGSTFYLTDANGRTLYRFKNDTKNTNNFTAANLSNNGVWPVAEINTMKFPSIVNAADFATITVHGKTQITYKGWPLYYFGQDTARGDNKGISFPSPNVWPILNTDTSLAP
ncbi:putative lipoprotein with Yx(FWY)xxD motif [Chryseobacterium sp. H1D6B]|uniref:hypothetical protein n=1 Tax=Chryseobacterium sp. H1D6B TaxID=2940588 RepID=UPI0017F8808C|nr:hypothetical protein [Chryseobacterium sp. H1D6B]MDH6252554.1 putative lipoprotein with Yx(FWY)xxD motif [Chryseobacterium sp. H1D6B]